MSAIVEPEFSPEPVAALPDSSPPPHPGLGYVRPRVTAGLVAGALGFGVLIGSGLPGGIAGTLADDSLTGRPEFTTLERTWELIHSEWAAPDDIDDSALIYGAARGMVDAIGDQGHSAFLDPEMVQEQASEEAASYVGIGVEVDSRCGVPIVTSTFKGSPAPKAMAAFTSIAYLLYVAWTHFANSHSILRPCGLHRVAGKADPRQAHHLWRSRHCEIIRA